MVLNLDRKNLSRYVQTEVTENQDFTNQRIGLSVGQAAKYLGVSIASIRRWTDQGALNCFRTPGNQRRFSLQELDRFAKTVDRRTPAS